MTKKSEKMKGNTIWLRSANPIDYRHSDSFNDYGSIDWRQGNNKFKVNDIVYIYSALPIQKIMYKCRVDKINLTINEIRDDRAYWLKEEKYLESLHGKFIRLVLIKEIDDNRLHLTQLKLNGLNTAPQGPRRMPDNVYTYVDSIFESSN